MHNEYKRKTRRRERERKLVRTPLFKRMGGRQTATRDEIGCSISTSMDGCAHEGNNGEGKKEKRMRGEE